MSQSTTIRRLMIAPCALLATLLAVNPVLAQGHGGGGHAGALGAGHAGGGARGYGGYHGGYGGHRGGYGGWGWGWGLGALGYGLFLATLPLVYATYWLEGVPYYYANNNYYTWNGAVGQYETVSPPPGVVSQAVAAPASAGGAAALAPEPAPAAADLFAYPKNGQSETQQASDRYECHRWAVSQIGFDPVASTAPTPAAKRQDYRRAQAACLEGRGYSVQ
jgi:hypothetical protein